MKTQTDNRTPYSDRAQNAPGQCSLIPISRGEYRPKKEWHRRRYSEKERSCNLCGQSFKEQYKYQLFCKKCRYSNDTFQFHEWLPRAPERVVNGN